ncbi:hypothetical protein [Spirosoma sp. KUDC1026]|uniref:hypothetical protein n=1 Tax=Spirosoma sp. KUDC1026 TaxID=2745947 RepID=UPI00159B97E6|nr:hypothetical protein [Spirosoma sp. KUDC1026]QKZ13983.1 hypothetical protein HU175_15640 [Spirosoma sp. KUDC1026]
MIRILYDEHGGYHQDLFVKIEERPSRVLIADSTWLGSFFYPLDEDESTLLLDEEQRLIEERKDISRLINLWISLLTSEQATCYLPVDLGDQSSSALQITKAKKLYQVREVYTEDIVDGTPEAYFLANQSAVNWKTSDNYEWKISQKAILTGLNWSLARLELPIVPLIYD